MNCETTLRFIFFFGIFAIVALGEIVAPRRQLTTGKGMRWFTNMTMVALDTAIVRLLFPTLPVGIALLVGHRDWGFLNYANVPLVTRVIGGVVLLDFAIYLQHALFHNLPILWRIHRMHHTDLDLDVTTGNRFHPLEIILSLGIKAGTIVLTGAPALSVIIFEIILNGTSMFNHGNIAIPQYVDRWLRLLIVTPDMHRVHHSVIPRETNSNYGFSLPWWDRLFGTYRDQPEAGHEGMTIGLREFRDPAALTLPHLLLLPFKSR